MEKWKYFVLGVDGPEELTNELNGTGRWELVSLVPTPWMYVDAPAYRPDRATPRYIATFKRRPQL